ncbi:MAG: anti-sigma factor [Bacteroidota bacterium]
MTDPKEYISSGILELYVSGKLSESEADEVRRMADEYPEIQAEILEIEESLAELAQVFTRKPQRDLLAGIMDQLEDDHKTPLIKLGEESSKALPNFRWLALAAAIALLISLAMNVLQYQQIQDARIQIAALDQEKQVFADQIERTNTQLKVISSPLYREVPLLGRPISPSSLATVFYSSNEKRLFLNTGNLSNSDQDKQFQLWAIIDGQPVDAGVFDPSEGLIELKGIAENVDAFAITLEKRGGSPTPTLDMMYVSGAVG